MPTIPTLEILAATDILRRHFSDLKICVVNVVDLTKLQLTSEHPHGLPDKDFDLMFTNDKSVIFASHGYSTFVRSTIGHSQIS